MKVELVQCGEYANESERRAAETIKTGLISAPGNGTWYVLTNVSFAASSARQADEIDMIIVGPPGVIVVEVKHWSDDHLRKRPDIVQTEVEKLTAKTKRVAGTLRKTIPSLPFVQGKFLLTSDAREVKRATQNKHDGIPFYHLTDWEKVAELTAARKLSDAQITRIRHLISPPYRSAPTERSRRFGDYVDLVLVDRDQKQFHSVFRARHPRRKDNVLLHLYDLSAFPGTTREARTVAEREYRVLHECARYDWAPRIVDSFQTDPQHLDEIFFFSVLDPIAPSLRERQKDAAWSIDERLEFAHAALHALHELHGIDKKEPILHRGICPDTVLVKADNTPILSGFSRARLPTDTTIADHVGKTEDSEFVAPEVQSGGLSAADTRADVYSMCATLAQLFRNTQGAEASDARELLEGGMASDPQERMTLDKLIDGFDRLASKNKPRPRVPVLAARYWSEGHKIDFAGQRYRIVSKLGSGGTSAAFKVVHLDEASEEEIATYVAKVVFDKAQGEDILKAHKRVRPYLGSNPHLVDIYEFAKAWDETKPVAILRWIDGPSLEDGYIGVLPLLAEEHGTTVSELLLRWATELCDALRPLHQNGLIHGDITPRNLLVHDGMLVLTDYDCVTQIGESCTFPGTIEYCSPEFQRGEPVSPSDDIYAIASSLFRALSERFPFRHDGNLEKSRGLNWEGIAREELGSLADFFDKATAPNRSERFESCDEALGFLKRASSSVPATGTAHDGATAASPAAPSAQTQDDIGIDAVAEGLTRADPTYRLASVASEAAPAYQPTPAATVRTEGQVEWLRGLLQCYPGSRWGNRETRGLDTEFAELTYVDTGLEDALIEAVKSREARLIILCGNAGDGKTALLQRIAQRLGLEKKHSADRVLEATLDDGLHIRMNFDGSASWKDRSADEMLSDFFGPFRDGLPHEDLCHFVAINDGKLMEWLEGEEPSPLHDALYALLEGSGNDAPKYLRFIDLNRRSLVGNVDLEKRTITTDFLEHLLDTLYGGDDAERYWEPCYTCTASSRCQVFQATKLFGPSTLQSDVPDEVRKRARERLFEALQAVHLLGRVHITMRELRAALVYILFGLHHCDDYHRNPDLKPEGYWDRAFSARSNGRQGEVLAELARLDPALEAHPKVDRYLQSDAEILDPNLPPRYRNDLAQARRRAYFEWLAEHGELVGGTVDALDLAHGSDIAKFRDLALCDEQERSELCRELCRGISHLEEIPAVAANRPNVPLRILPRTPTETVLWVEKDPSRFSLRAELPPEQPGIDRLHRTARLDYQYGDGRCETVRLSAELFHLLRELARGFQLGDQASDDIFSNLSIYVHRIAREDETTLFAWNPMADEKVFRLVIEHGARDGATAQVLRLLPIEGQG